MDNFFTTLFDNVFPWVGEFVGIITGFAELKPNAIILWLEANIEFPQSPTDLVIQYFNLFKGISGNHNDLVHYAITIPGDLVAGGFINIKGFVATVFYNLFVAIFVPFGFDIMPMWIALPCAFAVWGLFLSIVKFFIGLINFK